jgi:phage/plasmid-like protein (TIGR03299 family)
MAHNLDINAGQASFVSARVDAWHQLGTVLPDTFTAEEAMEHGLLGGWNLRKTALHTEVGGKKILVPNMHAVVRDNPVTKNQVDVLGTVGNAYQIIQNEQLAGLLNALVDEGGAHFETAGAIDGGRKVFITMKLPSNIKIGGVDRVDTYLAAMTSHDGSTSTQLMPTPIRVVCENTLNMAFGGAKNSGLFRVRHTVGAEKILIQQAREALDFTFDYLDGFQADADKLINTTMTQMQFEELITREFGAPEDAPVSTLTRTENKLDQMSMLFADANTQEGIRNTAWAGLNALTEWYDHFSPVRGAGVNTGSEDELRSRKALLDPSFKNDALRMMLALV